MDFKRYVKRVLFLNYIYGRSKGAYKNEYKIQQRRFQVQETEMKITSVS